MKPRVYIETTIPSFYHEVRSEPSMVARREWTREWWDECREDYEIVTSVAVLDELATGDHPRKASTLALLDDVPLLSIDATIVYTVEAYVENHVMPADPQGDALHLAIASHHHCQFLLTWNCTHLANANKFEHIRHINHILGLFVPTLTTPLELINMDT